MKTGRIAAILLVAMLLLSTVACAQRNGEDPSAGNSAAGSVLKAWVGEYSEENHKQAIDAYKKEYRPIELDETGDVVIVVDEKLTNCHFPCIGAVGLGYSEMNNFIDLYQSSEYDEATNQIKFNLSWMLDSDSWVYSHKTWSFLIRATTQSGEQVYYYLRVTRK